MFIKSLLRFVIAGVLGASLSVAASGCAGSQLAPNVAKAVEIAECQLEGVRALVPHVETADAAVAAFRIGDIQRGAALLLSLGMSIDEIQAVAKAFDACIPDAPVPEIPASLTLS